MREWIAFWNSANSIYVNARHRDVHYRKLAEDLRAYIAGPTAVVLDYGCGEALHADRIAAAAGRLILCDAAPAVRAALSARFAGQPKIEVRPPDEVGTMADASLDLVLIVSVAQYLAADEFDRLLVLFRRLLRPGGRLLLGDVVPPSISPLTDALALIRFAASHGFLLAAIGGLLRTAFSDYRKLRRTVGITVHEPRAMLARLSAAGFAAVRADKNIGHNAARMTFVATRPG